MVSPSFVASSRVDQACETEAKGVGDMGGNGRCDCVIGVARMHTGLNLPGRGLVSQSPAAGPLSAITNSI